MSCTIRQVTTDEARAFWLQQADARIFLHPDVLEPMCERVDWWLASWKGNPVCLWPVCEASDGSFNPPELSAYVGPLWHDSVRTRKPHRWWTITSEVERSFLMLLGEQYLEFMFELPPGTQDVRWLQWFSQESAATHTITIEPRHTALIRHGAGSSGVLENFSRNRLKDLRRLKQSGYQLCTDPSIEALCDLYESMLAKKGRADVAQRRRNEVKCLVSSAMGGFGNVIAYSDGGGEPETFILLLDTRKTTLAIVLASSTRFRSEGVQALLHLEAIQQSFDAGKSIFDFAGGNSRLGAEEKHRYGAWPALYFRVRVSRTKHHGNRARSEVPLLQENKHAIDV